MELLQKEQDKNAADYARQIKELSQKNNHMQTQFENAKQATWLAQSKGKEQMEQIAETSNQLETVHKTVTERE